MYTQGSLECLTNSQNLFKDATILLQSASFGVAQSIIVTAIEEAAKAIILELANLNYINKDVVKDSMLSHKPKKLVFLAIEKGLLFVEDIDRRQNSCIIDKNKLRELENDLKAGSKDLENKRQDGFYVQVDINNGGVINYPNNIEKFEIEEFAKKAKSFLKFSEVLCKFLRDYRESARATITRNIVLLRTVWTNEIADPVFCVAVSSLAKQVERCFFC